MYLYGKNSVLERLKSDPDSVIKIFTEKGFGDTVLLEKIRSKAVPHRVVSQKELLSIKRADRLQGIVAEVKRFEYTDFDALLRNEPKLSLVLLDNINDPHNLGSIIRITACFGNIAVIIPRHASCEVNDTVMHVASGGENFVPVSMVTNMTTALIKAKKAGYWITGATAEEGENLNEKEFPLPACIVLGSEGKGIRHGLRKHLDLKMNIPMKGAPLSFNVSMACAIFCYEISKQTK